MTQKYLVWVAIALCSAGIPFSLLSNFLMNNHQEIEATRICNRCDSYGQKPIPLKVTEDNNKKHMMLVDLVLSGSLPQRIGLVFGTYGLNIKTTFAKLEIYNSQNQIVCRFDGEEQSILDNKLFSFQSAGNCNFIEKNHTGKLEIETDEQGPVALWAHGPISRQNLESLAVPMTLKTSDSGQDSNFAPMGFTFNPSAAPARPIAERLAFMWNKGLPSVWLLITAMSFAFLLLAFAVTSNGLGRWLPALYGLIVFCIASSICFFVPPFQAPDEPDHALTMAIAMKSDQLTREFEDLGRRTHLERIKFHPEEKFFSKDIEKGADVPWSGHVAPTELSRSAITARLWPLLAHSVSGMRGADALLYMRCFQSLIFAFSVAVSAWVLGPALSYPVIAAWLMIPTIPFFAMHVSNYGFLLAFSIVFSSAFLALLWGRKDVPVGFLMGTAIALMLASSRSVWPFAPTLGAACLLGTFAQAQKEPTKQKIKYWAALSLGIAIFWFVVTPEFLNYTIGNVTSRLPAKLRTLFESFSSTPIVAAVIFLVGLGLDWLISKLPRNAPKVRTRITKFFVIFAISGLLFSYLMPYLKPQFVVPDIETPAKLPLFEYLKKTVILAGTIFRWGNHDFYVSGSFYGGIGWLEALLPSWSTSIVLLFAAAGLVCIVLYTHKSENLRALLGIGLMLTGLLASVALSAKGNWDESVNLHGRYLIPYHISIIAICFSGFAFLPKLLSKTTQKEHFAEIPAFRWVLVGSVVVLQTNAVLFILKRYFV